MATVELIPLASPDGATLLSEARRDGFYNPHIPRVFAKQIGRKNCGIQSAALLLSSASLAIRDEAQNEQPRDAPFTEQGMFDMPQTTRVATQQLITEQKGLTLQEVADVLKSHGKSVEVFHASDSDVDEFRKVAMETLKESGHGLGVMVNYDMSRLGQVPLGGHHSPLGAYHVLSDRFLIFDTWPDTEVSWAEARDLFSAMTETDGASGRSRGFLVVRGDD